MEPEPGLGDQPVEIMDGRARMDRAGELVGADLENQSTSGAADATRARTTTSASAVWPVKPNNEESDQGRAHATAERRRSGPAETRRRSERQAAPDTRRLSGRQAAPDARRRSSLLEEFGEVSGG